MFIFRRRFSTFLQLSEASKLVQQNIRQIAENELKPLADLHDKLAKYVVIMENSL